MKFKDRVVFITGGTRGLGKAMAHAFLSEGASVAVNDKDAEMVASCAEEFKGKVFRAITADITNYDQMETVAAQVCDEWGRVDVLINGAGIVTPMVPAEKVRKADFDRIIDINLKGTFYVTQIFGRKMIAQKGGRIISMASQAALFGERGFLSYAVSKGGVMTMTRSIAYEWGRYGITACAVAPGFMAGGMNEGLLRRSDLVDFITKRVPIGKMGQVDELVATMLFLASPEASYINGETLVFDGGATGYAAETLLDAISKGR
jgi:NAD(P)-dependent dehydrogenase (short-subunit alcohol dehydrogenase family)